MGICIKTYQNNKIKTISKNGEKTGAVPVPMVMLQHATTLVQSYDIYQPSLQLIREVLIRHTSFDN